VAFVRETEAGDAAVVPRRSGGVDRGAVCGLLMELLHDVSVRFVCLTVLLFFMVMSLTSVFVQDRLLL
jgi:hypothetical protein